MVEVKAGKLKLGALLTAMVWMGVAAGAALGQASAVQAAGQANRQALGQAAPAGQAASKLEFDVASVRPSAPLDMAKLAAQVVQSGKMPSFGAHVDASRATYTYMTLKELIANAYGVKDYQITGPSWLGDVRFDIAANLPEGATKDDAPKMLQALLADRFKMEAHRESAEHPVLALVVGKDGPKLKASPAAPEPIDPDAPLKPGETKLDTGNGPIRITTHADGTITENMGAKGTVTIKMDGQTIHMDADTVTMDGFADMLTGIMQMGGGGGKQVVDMTGLKGNYQVALEISMADILAIARAQGMDIPMGGAGAAGGAAAPEASDPGGSGTSAYAAVEKLGLKLESRKAMVEQVVVNSAEKTPTEN